MLQLGSCQAEGISCKISGENLYHCIRIPCCLLYSRKGFLASLCSGPPMAIDKLMLAIVLQNVFIRIDQAFVTTTVA